MLIVIRLFVLSERFTCPNEFSRLMGEVNSRVPLSGFVVIKSAAALRTYDGFWHARLILAGKWVAYSIVNSFISCS
jgi:hypothetical protein